MRRVVVVAHPDDETVGLGARLHLLRDARFVHVTDGAPVDGADARANGFPSVEAYAKARRAELAAVFADAGIDPDRTMELGCPDQQVASRLRDIVPRLRALLADADLVLTHPYEGGHPDHDATALLVRLTAPGSARIVEMGFYHRGADGRPDPSFLPHEDAGHELVLPLDPVQRAIKERRLRLFESQRGAIGWLGPQTIERVRVAPRYDFARPPHDGPVLYESFGWGIREADVRAQFLEVLS